MALYYGADPARMGDSSATDLAYPDGKTNELFLKVFAGEVITTFEENNAMLPLTRVRTISSGKSAQFPTSGVATAKYHVPGESIMGTGTDTGGDAAIADASKYLSKPNAAERVIWIDDMLISSVFLADIDEAKNHYDVRSIYSTEIGRALAYAADKNLIRVAIAAARKTTDRFGVASGTSTTYLGAQIDHSAANGGSGTAGDKWVDVLFQAAQKMDEKNVPSTDRYALLPPASYYDIISTNKDAINRDYGNEGNPSVAFPGEMISVAGIKVMKSNHIPTANEGSSQDALHGADGVMNDTAGASAVPPGTAGSGYSAQDYSTTEGIIFQSEGIGTVKLMDLAVETDYSVDRQGTMLVAKYAMGHGALREECCYEVVT